MGQRLIHAGADGDAGGEAVGEEVRAVLEVRVAAAEDGELGGRGLEDGGQRVEGHVDPLLPCEPRDDGEQGGLDLLTESESVLEMALAARLAVEVADVVARR